MSDWAGYVKSVKQRAPDDMDTGCIVGKEGSIWVDGDGTAKKAGILPQEAQAIASCFQKKNFSSMQSNGFRINNQKYTFVNYDKDQDVVVGRAKGKGGATLQGTKRAVIVAICREGGQLGTVSKAIGEIGSHLRSSGY